MLHQKIASSVLLAFLTVFSLSPPVALLAQSQAVTEPAAKTAAVTTKTQIPETTDSGKTSAVTRTDAQPVKPVVKPATGTTPVTVSVTPDKPAAASAAPAVQTVTAKQTTTAPANVTGTKTVAVQPPVPKTYQTAQTATRNNQTVPVQSTGSVSNYQFQMLARIISAEAKGEPLEGQVAVGAVILNRVKSGKFPDNIAANVLKRGQFEPVANGHIWREPTSSAIRAARLALKGWDPTNGALYFFNPVKSSSRWIWSRTVITRIGNHVFAV